MMNQVVKLLDTYNPAAHPVWQLTNCPHFSHGTHTGYYNVHIHNNKTKMILKQIGSNQTELTLNNGNSIFFSYETPVAGYSDEIGFFRTATYYSKTTSRHINAYLPDVEVTEVPEEFIVDLVNFDVRSK